MADTCARCCPPRAGDLRAALARARGKGAPLDFEIRTAFPPATFADVAQTLQQAGLVPNAALLLIGKGAGVAGAGAGGG